MPNETLEPPGIVIGLDIGGTKTHAAAFDERYNLIAELRKPTVTGDIVAVGEAIVASVTELKAKLNGSVITTIGIGIPGLIDRESGTVRQAVNLGIGDDPLDIVSRVTDVYDVDCHIDNDVNVAALGAYHLLRSGDVSDLAYLSIGTGIAAGVILHGNIHRGHRGVAGEIGHFPIMMDGPECECGLTGCLETLASGSAIARQWPTTGSTSPTESLIEAAKRGDDEAVAVLGRVSNYLAKAVYLLAITYDVDRIVVGGGVADLDGLLLDIINDGLGRLEQQSAFVRSLQLPSRVILKPAGPVGAIGAAALANPRYAS